MGRQDAGDATLTARFSRRVRELTGADSAAVADDVRRRLFVLAFVSLLVPVVAGFAVSDLLTAEIIDALIETAFAFALIGMAVLLWHVRRPELLYHSLLISLLVLMTYLISDPLEGSSRLFWLYNVVPVATFTVGRWKGGIYGAIMLLIVVLLRLLVPELAAAVPSEDFIRFVVTYEILAVMVFLVEYARERTHRQLVKEHGELAIAHKEILRLSVTDALTSVYNRQFLNDRVPAEIERARRYGHPLSILLCDVDRFKAFNDTYGHRAGDAILQIAAGTLAHAVRHGIDWVARYGGEEFLVVLPETAADHAMVVAERLRLAVSEVRLEWDGTELSCTASFGLAELGNGVDSTAALIEAADQALLRAKQQGRNRVVRHLRGTQAPPSLAEAT